MAGVAAAFQQGLSRRVSRPAGVRPEPSSGWNRSTRGRPCGGKRCVASDAGARDIGAASWRRRRRARGAPRPARRPCRPSIQEIMDKPRYADATWSLLVTDVETGETFYALNPDQLSLTGSTRKLFSVGLALDTLGADHRQDDPGPPAGRGRRPTARSTATWCWSAAATSTFGGRRIDADTVEYTNFDHNDANNLGTGHPHAAGPAVRARRPGRARCERVGHHLGQRRRGRRRPPVRALPRAERQPADHAGDAQREHGRRHRHADRGRPAGDRRRTGRETAAFTVDGTRRRPPPAGTEATVDALRRRAHRVHRHARVLGHGVRRRSRSTTRRR